MNSRVKEIGIRRVNGATVLEIVKMLNDDFVKWGAVEFVIAVSIAWYMMDRWLENLVYKIELSWWIFTFARLLAFPIALITVVWQTFFTARINLVEVLHVE